MTAFDAASLWAFAAFAVLGLVTPFLLAAKNRRPHLAVLALLIAAWAVTVLVSAAVMLA